MNHILAIYDTETTYAKGLLDYIQKKAKIGLKVHTFTNTQSLNEYTKNYIIAVLLVNESIDLKEINSSNIKSICILGEGEKDSIDSSYPIIYKYQSAREIMEQLLLKLPKELFQKPNGNKNSLLNIISFCSLDYKKKQSVIAYSLAREYSKHKKVLYINLHSWQVLSKQLGSRECNGITEIIYYLRQKSSSFISKMINTVVKVEGLDCIYGTSFGIEVEELTSEDTKLWIEQLHMWNQYEIVIFDVGNINLATIGILNSSSEIIYTMKKNAEDELEFDVLKNQLEFAKYQEIVEKMKVFNISDEKEDNVLELLH